MKKKWNRSSFGKVQKKINDLKARLQKLENEAELSAKFDEWLAREELLWKQRSRMDLLMDGDNKAAFFKIKATQRRDKKIIERLNKEDGEQVTNTLDIMTEFANYFSNLFQVPATEEDIHWLQAFEDFTVTVPEEVNQTLRMPYTFEEIKQALKKPSEEIKEKGCIGSEKPQCKNQKLMVVWDSETLRL